MDEIPTVRAFDDPGISKFYYRLKYVKSSIVDKSHVIYALSDKRIKRYKELFLQQSYEVKVLPSYLPEIAANPMRAFEDLPVKSRYMFLLDDSRFFIEGFIKGPVCRGQVALNVIEDNFWVLFSDPEKLVINNSNHYMDQLAEQLNLPAEKGNNLNIFSIWTTYWQAQHQYMLKKQEYFKQMARMDLEKSMQYIWNGKNGLDENNKALTVFRHFDSATVKQGLLGQYPETTWLLDYPLLERIHYLLVAGYDVYGNIGHQAQTRIYMDFLRMEGENGFLAYLPVSQRRQIRDSWYEGIRGDIKKFFEQPDEWLDTQVVFGYTQQDTQRELYETIEHYLNIEPDDINRCDDGCQKNKQKSQLEKSIQSLSELKGDTLSVLPDISLLKIEGLDKSQVYTLIYNKAYKNISFILESVEGRSRELDTLTVYKGVLGAYPNFFFKVKYDQIDQFVSVMKNLKTARDRRCFYRKVWYSKNIIKFLALRRLV